MKKLILGFCLIYLLMPKLLWAHGLGKQQLERVPVGPYRVTAWTDPITVRTDKELHVTVAIEDEQGLVLDATVQVSATYEKDTTKREQARATHERAANKLHYEAPLDLTESGTWKITIAVEGETVSFDLDVEKADQSLPWQVIIGSIVGLLVFGFVVINRIRT